MRKSSPNRKGRRDVKADTCRETRANSVEEVKKCAKCSQRTQRKPRVCAFTR